MIGLSTSASISFGMAFVAGRKRVPKPAAGKTALRTLVFIQGSPSSGMEFRIGSNIVRNQFDRGFDQGKIARGQVLRRFDGVIARASRLQAERGARF